MTPPIRQRVSDRQEPSRLDSFADDTGSFPSDDNAQLLLASADSSISTSADASTRSRGVRLVFVVVTMTPVSYGDSWWPFRRRPIQCFGKSACYLRCQTRLLRAVGVREYEQEEVVKSTKWHASIRYIIQSDDDDDEYYYSKLEFSNKMFLSINTTFYYFKFSRSVFLKIIFRPLSGLCVENIALWTCVVVVAERVSHTALLTSAQKFLLFAGAFSLSHVCLASRYC